MNGIPAPLTQASSPHSDRESPDEGVGTLNDGERSRNLKEHKAWFIFLILGTVIASGSLYPLLDFFRETGHGSIIHVLAASFIIVTQILGGSLIVAGFAWRTMAIGPLRGFFGLAAALCFVPVDPTGDYLMFYSLPGLFAPFLIVIALPKPLSTRDGRKIRDAVFGLLIVLSIMYFFSRILFGAPAIT